MAQLAEHRAELDSDAVGMVINRIIDSRGGGGFSFKIGLGAFSPRNKYLQLQ